jgi:hypothetical protein
MMWLDWILIIVLILAIGIGAYIFLAYKHTIVIRQVVNNKKIISKKKFREFTDSNNTTFYKVMGFKEPFKAPQHNAIDTTPKGKKWVECYRNEQGDIQYIVDDHVLKEGFNSLSTEERVFHTTRIRRAEERRKKGWKENLPAYLQMMSSVVIVAILVFGYADFSESKIELERQQQINSELKLDLVDRIEEVSQGIQRLEGEKSSSTSYGDAPD